MGTLRGKSHTSKDPADKLTYEGNSVTSVGHDIQNHVHKHSEGEQNRDA